MRMGIVALVLLAIVAMLSTVETGVRTLTTFDREREVQPSPRPSPKGEGVARSAAAPHSFTVAGGNSHAPSVALGMSPSPLGEGRGEGRFVARIPTNLPPTLELVTLPSRPGAPAPAPKAISRTEALASAIGSQEFQDTVSPLARLYFATFGRFPDYEGLNYYTGQREEARPLAEIATEFAGSPEFETRYGELSNAEFVARIMANVLGHHSQADVRAYWTAELEAGRMTRGQVIVDLAESGMFRERTANQVFVSTAYTEILRRTPDPAGFAFWLAQLEAGQPRTVVIAGLLSRR